MELTNKKLKQTARNQNSKGSVSSKPSLLSCWLYKKKILYLLITFFIITYIGCETSTANQYRHLYENQILITDSLLIKTQELRRNIDSFYVVCNNKTDSLKSINIVLKTKIDNLNSKLDSLSSFYADITQARASLDTLLTIINNDVIRYIQNLKIK